MCRLMPGIAAGQGCIGLAQNAASVSSFCESVCVRSAEVPSGLMEERCQRDCTRQNCEPAPGDRRIAGGVNGCVRRWGTRRPGVMFQLQRCNVRPGTASVQSAAGRLIVCWRCRRSCINGIAASRGSMNQRQLRALALRDPQAFRKLIHGARGARTGRPASLVAPRPSGLRFRGRVAGVARAPPG
jgi:hypothetical protein